MFPFVHKPTEGVVCVNVNCPATGAAFGIVPAGNDHCRYVFGGEEFTGFLHLIEVEARVRGAVVMASGPLIRMSGEFLKLRIAESFKQWFLNRKHLRSGRCRTIQNDLAPKLAPIGLEVLVARETSNRYQFT